MIVNEEQLSPLDRLLSPFTRIRPGEAAATLLFGLYAFLLLASYYVLKPIREALILAEQGAVGGAYATGAQALLLMFLVPLYGLLFRSTNQTALVRWITSLFLVNIVIIYMMGRAEIDIGFIYFVFVGILGVMLPAQFWALAADSYNIKAGQRLFPVIMVGALAGAAVGPMLTRLLTKTGWVAPLEMLLVGGGLLSTTLMLGGVARRRVPVPSRCEESASTERESQYVDEKDSLHVLGGFALVMRDGYLFLIAILAILLNWVNSTGETILRDFVERWAKSKSMGDVDVELQLYSGFYADFYLATNVLGVIAGAFLVSRVYRWIGVRGALLVLPIIAAIGYGLMAFVPIFSVIAVVKIIENSTDYSLMNTTRQALFLPTGRAAKYEGKTVIDTFFWRFGDLVMAGSYYVGLNVFGFTIPQFAIANMVLALIWLSVAVLIGREYPRLVRENSMNQAPEAKIPIPDVHAEPGGELVHMLADDTFVDADPGDVLALHAHTLGGAPLPGWLSFHAKTRTFRGRVPDDAQGQIMIEVVATDIDGLSAASRFTVHFG